MKQAPVDQLKSEPAASHGISWSPVVAIVLVVGLYYVSQVVAVLLLSLYPEARHWSRSEANSWLQHSVAAQFVYVLLVESLTVYAVYLFLKWRKVRWQALGLRRPRWRDPLWGLAMLPLYYLTYLIAVAVLKPIVPGLDVDQSQQIGFTNAIGFGNLLLTFVSLVILPPLAEEILVRGFLYSSLRQKMTPIIAALLTSVIFASAHLQAGSGAPLLWIAFIDTFILSLYLVYIRQKTDSLWGGMTLHASKNLLAFVSLFILHLK